MTRLRVFVANRIADELVEEMTRLEPRIDPVFEPGLLADRWTLADRRGRPLERTPAQRERYGRLVSDADSLFGLPDESAAMLAPVVRANPGLRWVHTMAAGGGAQVKDAGLTDEELGRIAFTTSAGVHAGPLAEFALLAVLAGTKGLDRLQADQAASRWGERRELPRQDRRTVVVVGLGHIGRAVATMLAPLSAAVIGVHRRPVEVPGVSRVVTTDRLGEALALADAVVVALPGTAATTGLFDAAAFAAMRPGATFVNIGRGSVVDEPALVDALQDGRVGYAALDVFAREPLPVESPLWRMPNVLVSPHTAALDPRADAEIVELFADNAGRILDGRPLRNRVDTVEFY